MSSGMKVFALLTVASVGNELPWTLHSVNYTCEFYQWDATSQFQTDLFLPLSSATHELAKCSWACLPRLPLMGKKQEWEDMGCIASGRSGYYFFCLFGSGLFIWGNFLRVSIQGLIGIIFYNLRCAALGHILMAMEDEVTQREPSKCLCTPYNICQSCRYLSTSCRIHWPCQYLGTSSSICQPRQIWRDFTLT